MNFHLHKKTIIRGISGVLTASLLIALPAAAGVDHQDFWGAIQTFASSAKDIQNKAKDDLDKVNQDIENIKDNQSEVQSDLDQAAAKLDTILAKQKELQAQIKKTQEQVDQANKELEKAQDQEAEEYASMKLRIQYMYENSADTSLWSAILESNGITDMLNRIEYVSEMYKSDRKLLENYQETVAQVEQLTEELGEKMDELMQQQEEYEKQQSEMEGLIADLQEKKDEYASQLSAAKEQAAEYQKTIEEQGRIIQQQEAEAARKAAEEERKRKEAEERKRQQEAAQQAQANESNDDSGSSDSSEYEGGGSGESGLGSSDYLSDPSVNPSPSTDVSGQDVVNYAMKFVGNPYKWGGNSLTNGVDCSGFVHQVYAHFGISTPRYSQSFKTVGKAVSYSNMQAGDVVVYPGHVAIYIGNGCIVEAQSTKAGITCTRSVDCHTILAIRRLV